MEAIAVELFQGLQTSVSELSAKLAAQEGIINNQKTTIDDQTKLIDEQMRLIVHLRKQLTDTSPASASNSSSSWADLVKGKSSASTAAVVAIISGQDVVNWASPFSTIQPGRGHRMRLAREIVHDCDQRHHFFTNRVVNNWNALPDSIASIQKLKK
jgi:uncharacterized coiled-coil protein SlyX